MGRRKEVTDEGRNKQLEEMKKYLEEIKKKGYTFKRKKDKSKENKASLGYASGRRLAG